MYKSNNIFKIYQKLDMTDDEILIFLENELKDDNYNGIYLSNIGLTKIPSFLKKLNNLHHLSLSFNEITKIENIPNNIKSLDLSNNNISELNSNSLSQNKLDYLNLEVNDITHVLLNNVSIDILDLSYNKINNFTSFYSFFNIINLFDNNLISFPIVKNVKILNLSKNKISKLFLINDTIEELNISSNNLEKIWLDTPNIQTLNIINNDLNYLHIGHLYKLTQLLLSSNKKLLKISLPQNINFLTLNNCDMLNTINYKYLYKKKYLFPEKTIIKIISLKINNTINKIIDYNKNNIILNKLIKQPYKYILTL